MKNPITIETFGPVTRYKLYASIAGKQLMPTSCYLVNETLIDTCHSHAGRIIKRLVQQLTIEQVVLTHYHEDHSGNSALIKSIKKVPVYGHPLTARKLKKGFGIHPYQHIMWGKSQPVKLLPVTGPIACGNLVMEPIHTPGHSFDHLAYYVAEEGWLFSGDLFLSSRIRYFRSDEDITETIASLKKALALDFDVLFCTHNPKPVGGKLKLKQKLNFLEDLCGEIGNLVMKGVEQGRIIKYYRKSETRGVKMFTLGDVSYENMIRSTLKYFAEKV